MIVEEMKLSGFGTYLGTRELGKKIKTEIIGKMGFGHAVLVDFEKVEGITNSFADECFGKLIVEIGVKSFTDMITFTNLDPTEKSIINYVLHNRSEK